MCYYLLAKAQKRGNEMENNYTLQLPRWDDLPDLDLYLEQVLSLIEKWLGQSFFCDEKKIMTKTMINNYVKQQVINPPVNKRYDRLSVASLFVVSILKTVYSMNDITKLIHLALEVNESGTSYDRFCDAMENAVKKVFSGEAFPGKENLSEAQYLLQMIAESFACTCYARTSYLSKV